MLEHTKTPLTSNLLVTFTIPRERRDEVLKLVSALGYQAKVEPEYTRFNEILEANETQTLAACLRGLRYRDGMTQEALAQKTGIPRRHISDFENGRRNIGKINAKKLADVFHVDPRYFLGA